MTARTPQYVRVGPNANLGTRLRRTNLRATWVAVLVATLLTFSWLSFVTQTHQHFDPGPYPREMAGRSGTLLQSTTGPSSHDAPATCPICKAIAYAGHYLQPTTITFDVPTSVDPWRTVTQSIAAACRQRSHAWYSRAPPHQPQP
jgi:hypothetical protein